MDENYKIIVNNVSKSYKMYNTPTDRLKEALSMSDKVLHREFFAVSNVSFRVKEGEILGIMGRNGAGKSTLLKMITGVLTPTYGAIELQGRISSLLELGAGFNMEYTGVENIHFYGTLMGLSKAQILERMDEIIAFSEIGDYVHQPVKTYSSGMFARLAFSCAINVDPEILIVDEILSVGDIRFQAKCFKKFNEFKKRGVTILYVGHDISTMRTFCDCCLWMHNGGVVAMGEPLQISAKYTEYMYSDSDDALTTYIACNDTNSHDDSKDRVETMILPEEDIALPDRGIEQAFSSGNPLAHWGSEKGTMCNILFFSKDQSPLRCATPYEQLTIQVRIPYLKSLDYETMSLAFSLKNKEGVDLIVKTTWDDELRFQDTGKDIVVSFSFEPRLTAGDYYLVLALESRKDAVINYYEYIEGASYFKIFEDKGLFGKFLPDVCINIGESADE